MSRRAHKPSDQSREIVKIHGMVGTSHEMIADILDIDAKTLRKHYRKELNQSKAKANATIGGALFNKARGGDTTAMIFWMKTQAGWRGTGEPPGDDDIPPTMISFEVEDGRTRPDSSPEA